MSGWNFLRESEAVNLKESNKRYSREFRENKQRRDTEEVIKNYQKIINDNITMII